MNASIPQQIARFQAMTVSELRGEWERLYGEPTRSRNRVYLWRRLAWRVQELELGGLSDVAKARIAELAQDGFTRAQIPRGFNPEPMAAPRPRRDPRLPTPGSTLTRHYKGQDIRVRVGDDHFDWDGRRFDSLSEVAYAVTGSRCLQRRQREIDGRQEALDAQDVDPEAVRTALAQFTAVWDVLLAPERQRVVRLLIERVDYDGGELKISFSATGVRLLTADVASAEPTA